MNHIDLNCDLGENESAACREELMSLINSANVACGGHAGSDETMLHCAQLAARHHVHAGAHPGLCGNFGRDACIISATELIPLIDQQIRRLLFHLTKVGIPLHHIKLHGSLYHATDNDEFLSTAFCEYVKNSFPGVIIYARSGGLTAQIAHQLGVTVWEECFLDRGYRADGSLIPRGKPGDLLDTKAAIQERVTMITEQCMILHCGESVVKLACQTLCLHSDGAHAISFAKIAAQKNRSL
jgi:5-oxoprolinase (ATP-hydrolysing) subunit A